MHAQTGRVIAQLDNDAGCGMHLDSVLGPDTQVKQALYLFRIGELTLLGKGKTLTCPSVFHRKSLSGPAHLNCFFFFVQGAHPRHVYREIRF